MVSYVQVIKLLDIFLDFFGIFRIAAVCNVNWMGAFHKFAKLKLPQYEIGSVHRGSYNSNFHRVVFMSALKNFLQSQNLLNIRILH